MMGIGGGYRYLRISVSGQFTHLVAAHIAHELQHALEIAEAPGVTDSRTLVELYRRIGYSVSFDNAFETENAKMVEKVVLHEYVTLLERRNGQTP
jgi:hypothetical protein